MLSLCAVLGLNDLHSRFHWPSNISCSIATAVLEDRDFVETFLQKSHYLLRSHQGLAVKILEEAGIPFAPGRSVSPFYFANLQNSPKKVVRN